MYFEYLVNLALLKEKSNQINLDFEYQNTKELYNNLLVDFLDFIENDIKLNEGQENTKKSFIDFINTLSNTNNNINMNDAISKLEFMHYIEQSDYLKLLSKYSKLNDSYLKLNNLEIELDLIETTKPIILILIENLFINSNSNVNYDIEHNNVSDMHQGFKNFSNKKFSNDNFSRGESSRKKSKKEIDDTNEIVFFKNLNGHKLNPGLFVKGDSVLITNK